MDPIILSALISGIASLAMSFTNSGMQSAAQRDQYDYNRQAVGEDRAYYSPANQMQMMKDAGYNPHIQNVTVPQFTTTPRQAVAPELDNKGLTALTNVMVQAQKLAQGERKLDQGDRSLDQRDTQIGIEENNSNVRNSYIEKEKEFLEGRITEQQWDFEKKKLLDDYYVEVPMPDGSVKMIQVRYLDVEQQGAVLGKTIAEINGISESTRIMAQRWLDEHNLNLLTAANFYKTWDYMKKNYNLSRVYTNGQIKYINKEISILNKEGKNKDLQYETMNYEFGLRKKYEKMDRVMEVGGFIFDGIGTLSGAASGFMSGKAGMKNANTNRYNYQMNAYRYGFTR